MIVNLYSTLQNVPDPDFPHKMLGRRTLSDPELLPHLDGFVNYVASKVGPEMNNKAYGVLRHLQRVRHQCSLEIEEAQLDRLAHWAARANGICFMQDGSVRDAAGRILVDPEGGGPDPDAVVPFPPGARERQERTHKALAERGIALPPHLPPVLGEEEAQTRTPDEVARRVLALTVVAIRAESVGEGDPLDLDVFRKFIPSAFASLTPQEQEFVTNGGPDDAPPFTWRYEALALLLWALGQLGDLPEADEICDVPEVARLMRQKGEAILQEPQLRPLPALLDALDRHYRLHWACREAQLRDQDPPDGLVPGVVLERHYALNWLFRFEEAEWDDVDTPT